MQHHPQTGHRLIALDLARSLALVAMAIFHFGFDLESFGLIAPGTMQSGVWYYYARSVAGSFLFMAGLGLWLAHGQGIRWRAFGARLVRILAAALAVTLATRVAMGPYYVFFGILHVIALASLVGLTFLRLPAGLTLLVAWMAFLAPTWVRSDLFNAPWLLWTGLSTAPVYSVDFEPAFPWLAPFLAGVASARIAGRFGLWDRSARRAAPARALRIAAWPGRHSLFVYLVHQPVLIGCLTALIRLGVVGGS